MHDGACKFACAVRIRRNNQPECPQTRKWDQFKSASTLFWLQKESLRNGKTSFFCFFFEYNPKKYLDDQKLWRFVMNALSKTTSFPNLSTWECRPLGHPISFTNPRQWFSFALDCISVVASFLYGVLPGLQGQFISVKYPRLHFSPRTTWSENDWPRRNIQA